MTDRFNLSIRQCDNCSREFQPAPRGYNARYCSAHCKSVAKYKREKGLPRIKDGRKRHYEKLKKDSARVEKHRNSSRKYRQKGRRFLARYKLIKGCIDCGYKKCAGALQLDHTGDKSISISLARSSISRLKEEIRSGKCEVRCANCHAEKTEERRCENK